MDPNKIIAGDHPITGKPVNLKWYRGASRYNNGATRYGRKYRLRYIIGLEKEAKWVSSKWHKSSYILSKVIVADEKPILIPTMLPV